MMPNLTNSSKATDLRTAVVVALGLGIVVSVTALASRDSGRQMASAPVTISAVAPQMIRTAPAGSAVVVEARTGMETAIR